MLVIIGPVAAQPGEPSAAELEFFEKRIRPIFVEHCYECHGGDEVKGGLRLNSSSGWLAGGDSGPAIVSGKPDESLLVATVRYGGDIEMPPTGKLPAHSISLIEQWVARGTPAPRPPDGANERKVSVLDIEAARQFWSYRPVQDWPAPEVSTIEDAPTTIDRFLVARLDEAGLPPQPPADSAALARRLYFDLIGLPPTPDEIDRFLKDHSAGAYEALVDRLLASPHFGERWGRHWLDVVRYAESLTLRGFILPEAWRYRDWVIESFNNDRPYDEFLKHQIAGDLLPAETVDDRQRQLVATTFLALGNTNLEEQDKRQLDMDVVDEQLDVLGKAMLGQTIGCARCHDHKFDPITTRDYYALAGILRNVQTLEHENVSKWLEMPLPLPEGEESRLREQETALATLERQIADARQHVVRLDDAQASTQFGPAVLKPRDLPGIVVDDSQATKVGQWMPSQYSRRYIGDGYVHDLDQDKGAKTLTFAPMLPRDGRYEVRLAYTPGSNRAGDVPVTVFSADGEKTLHIDMREPPPLAGRWISLGQYQCEAAGQNFVLVATENTVGHVIADALQYLPVDDTSVAQLASGTAPSQKDSPELADWRSTLQRLEEELNERRRSAVARPKALTVVERKEIGDVRVHVRGSVHTLGDLVPRGFLQVVPASAPGPLPANESGRRELAEWIASAENPLTARVLVNRIWHWLMGEGLVRTVDNFGATGETPSHAELLDHLASQFVDDGWSVKRLVRSIVLSAAYRRSSHESGTGMRIDPDNRLLWRAHRKRLDAECLRDAMLHVSGELDLTPGGPTIRPGVAADFGYVDRDFRRSVYLPVFRNAVPELFEVFDFADTSMVVGRRNRSTVAPQALFMMNSPFVRERAQAAARRLLADYPASDDDAIDFAFRQVLGRPPTDNEAALAHQVLEIAAEDSAWTDLYQILFASLDFRYGD